MTTTQTISQQLTDLAARAATNFATASPAGTPWQTACKILNGHMVQAHRLDFGRQTWFEVDRSTEQLTTAQAAEKLAA